MGGTGRGAAAGGATHQPQATADTPAGPAGKAAALNPARPTATWAPPGGPALPPRRSFPRSASASAADHRMLWMEGQVHAVLIGWAQVLWPLSLRASAAVSSAAELTAPSISLAGCQPSRRYRRRGCRRLCPGAGTARRGADGELP